ncbi:unnamed protein product [Lupinus luteus]|uniref:Uncharacterized protein n=1 Tax=Lupinus luteus TaxID=3873 RepID=A0AAV1Y774_LUPLU
MKTHIDLNSPQQSKKGSKHLKGSFWSAPSVFTNKLHKWMQKHKMKKHHNETISTTFPVENPISDYCLRKRSCDTDPRFSLDIGRMSFENDPMYSFDEPRASLDGRRKSIDRSNSIKKTAAAVVNEMVELKCGSIVNTNANVNASKFGGFVDCDLRPNSLRGDCCSEKQTTELGFKDTSSVIRNGNWKGSNSKKSRRWSKAWSIWGFINRRGGNKDQDEDEDNYIKPNKGARHSFSESWQDLRGDHNGKGAFDGRLFRSNSSISHRNAPNLGGSFGIVRSNENVKKAKDEFVLERNKSGRYSPKSIDNGLLQLYLTPTRGSQRNGSVKNSNHANSVPRNLPPLY